MKVEKRKITEICEVQVCYQSETVCILYTVPDPFLLYTFKAQFTSHDLHNLKINILNERFIYLLLGIFKYSFKCAKLMNMFIVIA